MSIPNNSSPTKSLDNLQLLGQATKNGDTGKVAALLKNGETVLHFVLNNIPGNDDEDSFIEIFKIFHNAGINLNAKDSCGRTVLNIAFKRQLTELTERLIEWGANINEPDVHGNTIAHFLAENSTFSSIRLPDQSYQWQNPGYVDWLLSKGLDVDLKNINRDTPLHLAAKYNFPHILLTFLKHCRDIDSIDNDSRTVFHLFIAHNRESSVGQLGSMAAIFKINCVYMQLLLQGFSVDVVDIFGNTPVHLAAKRKKIRRVKEMMDSFTNVNAQNDRGETVLSILCEINVDENVEYEDEIVNLVRALVLNGTNIHASRKDGLTPVQIAALKKSARIFSTLLEYKANLTELWCKRNLLHLVCENASKTSKDDEYCSMIDLLVNKGCDVNAKDDNGTTPLHLASVSGTVAVIQRLIDYGANVHSREWIDASFTALHMAVKERKIRNIISLVHSNADVNAKDLFGRTPLHLAARLYKSKLTWILLELGAEVSVKDNKGYTPLYYAILEFNVIAMKKLLNYGADISDETICNFIVDFDGNGRVSACVMEHWIKLKSVGLEVGSYYKKYEKFISLRFQKECNEEVEALKTSSIDKRMSFYNFLHASPNSQCAYTNDKIFCKLVESSDFASKFPNYHGMILARYYKAMQRKSLLELARYNWYDITNVHLPDVCKYAILDNLTNMDLECFAKENEVEEPRRKESFVNCSEDGSTVKRCKRRRQ